MDAEPVETRDRPWWALVVAVLAAMSATWLVVTTEDPEVADEHAWMLEVAPGGEVTLASLPAEQRPVYEAAAADTEAFTAVRCYCGCEAFLEHRHLLDCFVRDDGAWERHATGCTVCLAEAEEVIDGRERGLPLEEISDRIDRRYGAITTVGDA